MLIPGDVSPTRANLEQLCSNLTDSRGGGGGGGIFYEQLQALTTQPPNNSP